MFIKLISSFIIMAYSEEAKLFQCKSEQIIFKSCTADTIATDNKLTKFFKISNKDDKKCASWTGVIEATCNDGKWIINETNSNCKYECTCCY